jgi:hypothetical protein
VFDAMFADIVDSFQRRANRLIGTSREPRFDLTPGRRG